MERRDEYRVREINISNFLQHLNTVYELALAEQDGEETEENDNAEKTDDVEENEETEDDDIYALDEDEEEVYVEDLILDCDEIRKRDDEEIIGDFEYIVEAIKKDSVFYRPGDDFSVDEDEDILELLKKTPKPPKVLSYKDGSDYKKKCKMLNEYEYTSRDLRKIYSSDVPKYTEEYIRSLTTKQEIKDVYLSRPDWKEKCFKNFIDIKNIETHKDYMCIMLNRENEEQRKIDQSRSHYTVIIRNL